MYNVKCYGVSISVTVKETLNSCGTRQVEQFNVQGNDAAVTDEQATKMLIELYRKVREDYKHVLVAADAVGPRGWSGAGGSTSRTDKFSLARFCEVNGWNCVPGGVNPNNSHEIRVYTSTFNSLVDDRVVEGRMPEKQDFSDYVRPEGSNDAEKLAKLIIDFLES